MLVDGTVLALAHFGLLGSLHIVEYETRPGFALADWFGGLDRLDVAEMGRQVDHLFAVGALRLVALVFVVLVDRLATLALADSSAGGRGDLHLLRAFDDGRLGLLAVILEALCTEEVPVAQLAGCPLIVHALADLVAALAPALLLLCKPVTTKKYTNKYLCPHET